MTKSVFVHLAGSSQSTCPGRRGVAGIFAGTGITTTRGVVHKYVGPPAMGIIRQRDPWARFIALLSNQELQDALVPELNELQRDPRVKVKFEELYDAICYAREASEEAERAHRTLTERQPWMRRERRGLLRTAQRLLQKYERHLGDVDEPLKEAKRKTASPENPFSSEPADLVYRQIEDVVLALEKEPILSSRPEGHQPQPWLQEADRRLKAAGVHSRETRDQLLRLYGLKPYHES